MLSRPESDPAGEPSWKVVEERFERTGCILHLHVGGEVIRTTPEHPFYVAGEGWKAAGSLASGDRIATLSGEWIAIEEVFDTQEWAPVYNLRVADYHTYFVGDETWAFAAWAHNAYFYHGTSAAAAASIIANGQNPALFECKKDFGKGVYTTRLLQQAIDWARSGLMAERY